MGLNVSNTEIVTNQVTLVNISNASGKYDDLRPSVTNINTAIDFNLPVMNKVMSANTTFTESNKATGKISIFTLDRSSTGHTPTFSANVKWANDATPTWADARYWTIGLVCWDNTTVRATASGYGSVGGPAPAETISLSGTSSSYNVHYAESNDIIGAGWKFKSNGQVWKTVGGVEDEQFQPSTEWCNVTPTQTYYIRATLIDSAGVQPLATGFTALDTWEALTSDREWYSEAEPFPPSAAIALAKLKIEISTTSNGSNIVATGYYQQTASVQD